MYTDRHKNTMKSKKKGNPVVSVSNKGETDIFVRATFENPMGKGILNGMYCHLDSRATCLQTLKCAFTRKIILLIYRSPHSRRCSCRRMSWIALKTTGKKI